MTGPWGLFIKVGLVALAIGGAVYLYQQHRQEIYQEGFSAGVIKKTEEIQEVADKQSKENKTRGNLSTADANELARLRQINTKLSKELQERIRNQDLIAVPTDSGKVSKDFVREWNSIATGVTVTPTLPSPLTLTTTTGELTK